MDCFIIAMPMKIHHRFEVMENDGPVSEESDQLGYYNGACLDFPVPHVQIIDLFSKKNQKEKIYSFYIKFCSKLSKMGM